jgi:tryptophan synthase alpha chain
MSTVSTVFEKAQAEDRAALVGYLPAGFPDKETAIRAALAMCEAGADVIEVGLPYSDPLMDGPVIADAVYRALKGGTRIADVLDTVAAIADAGTAALVMTYWNPVDKYGPDAFARDLASAGGAGLITPDLTPEEAGPWLAASDHHHLDRVFLVAPSSTPARIEQITKLCRGFVYAVSLMGITGTKEAVSSVAGGTVARIREHTDLPVAVGLGVNTRGQAAEVASFADGVIVGSAFVRRLAQAPSADEAIAAVRALTADLAEGVRRSRLSPRAKGLKAPGKPGQEAERENTVLSRYAPGSPGVHPQPSARDLASGAGSAAGAGTRDRRGHRGRDRRRRPQVPERGRPGRRDHRRRRVGGSGRPDPRRRRGARGPGARRAVAGHPHRRLDPRLPRRRRPGNAGRLVRLPPGAVAGPDQVRTGALRRRPRDRVRQRRRPVGRLVYPTGIRPPLVAAVGGRDLTRAPSAQL